MLVINNNHPKQKELIKDEESEDVDEIKLEIQSFRDIYKLFLRIKYQKNNKWKIYKFYCWR